jgi:hypothetical protein
MFLLDENHEIAYLIILGGSHERKIWRDSAAEL